MKRLSQENSVRDFPWRYGHVVANPVWDQVYAFGDKMDNIIVPINTPINRQIEEEVVNEKRHRHRVN